MLTLRCTQKLLERGLAEDPVGTSPTSTLGDWYANVLVRRPHHLVLCLSERTLLPVILPAKNLRTLPARLPEAICEILDQLGVARDAVEREREAMDVVRVGRTASRQMLGYLNDFMFRLEDAMDASSSQSLVEPALWLADTPCKSIDFSSPARATVAIFQTSAVLARAKCGLTS